VIFQLQYALLGRFHTKASLQHFSLAILEGKGL
jgi:hypothetical protein